MKASTLDQRCNTIAVTESSTNSPVQSPSVTTSNLASLLAGAHTLLGGQIAPYHANHPAHARTLDTDVCGRTTHGNHHTKSHTPLLQPCSADALTSRGASHRHARTANDHATSSRDAGGTTNVAHGHQMDNSNTKHRSTNAKIPPCTTPLEPVATRARAHSKKKMPC
jgi:hypothetical protein